MRQRVKEFSGALRMENVNPGTLVEVVIPSRAFSSAETRVTV
jgi:signal transduction histidine kinase